jgi:hypothetical protein
MSSTMASSILRSTSICAFISGRILFAAVDRMRDKTARDRSQAVQAGDPVDQLRDARPEVALDVGESQFSS